MLPRGRFRGEACSRESLIVRSYEDADSADAGRFSENEQAQNIEYSIYRIQAFSWMGRAARSTCGMHRIKSPTHLCRRNTRWGLAPPRNHRSRGTYRQLARYYCSLHLASHSDFLLCIGLATAGEASMLVLLRLVMEVLAMLTCTLIASRFSSRTGWIFQDTGYMGSEY